MSEPLSPSDFPDTSSTPADVPAAAEPSLIDISGVEKNQPDERLATFMQDDPIYQEMLRTLDRERIRMRLAIRYTLVMFGIFLVFAWIVSNRVIMFGFSEFVWLSRIRDGLFGLMAGLFSLTLWYGSPVWFRHALLTTIIRGFAGVFFVGVLLALYFPII